MLTVFVPMIGLILRDVSDGEGSILDWTTGVSLWLLAILFVPLYAIFAGRVRRAATAYVAMVLPLLPTGLALVDGGLRLSLTILGPRSTIVLAIGMVLGLATVPLLVRARRQWFQHALRIGHLSRSLDKATGTWDPRHDLEPIESSEVLSRPGCLLRLLPWIGPAIGMSLDNIFGQTSAARIFVYLAILLGYTFVYLPIAGALVQFLEFRRLEDELGRPIVLVDSDARG
jgi:hypothetical protein